jgi:lysophospholipase L1-like esterase
LNKSRPSVFLSSVAVAVVACTTAGCGASAATPTTPTTPDPGAPKITCPAAVTTLSSDGKPVVVSYTAPTVTSGLLPLTGPTCTPVSGAPFPIGTTTVNCTVTDAKQRTDACTFSATVLPPPTLTGTQFVAFGDSITWGEDGTVTSLLTDRAAAFLQPRVQLPSSETYPGALQIELRERYVSQMPNVSNQGLAGEALTGGTAYPRFQSVLSSPPGPYNILLLMEGANDLAAQDSTIENNAISILRQMIDYAKGRGLQVLLATLPPENPNGCCPDRAAGAALVPGYNDRLKLLAASENITLVDIYAAFNGDLTLIGFDGLHPTPAGYQLIADTFFRSIRATLETVTTTTTITTTTTSGFARRTTRR